MLFATEYLDTTSGFVGGYSKNVGSDSTTGSVVELVHRIRLKYTQLMQSFLKAKQKADKKKQPLSSLQKRAIKQAVDHNKLVTEAKSAARNASCDKIEKSTSTVNKSKQLRQKSMISKTHLLIKLVMPLGYHRSASFLPNWNQLLQ
jgi:hypothetical protein